MRKLINRYIWLGTKQSTEKLILDCSMPKTEMLVLGLNADGTQMILLFQHSIDNHMLVTGAKFAIQLKLLNTLNQDILYLLYVYNGLT